MAIENVPKLDPSEGPSSPRVFMTPDTFWQVSRTARPATDTSPAASLKASHAAVIVSTDGASIRSTGLEAAIHSFLLLFLFLHTSTNEVGDLHSQLLSSSAFAL